MANSNKLTVCFLCLRSFQKNKAGHSHFNCDVDPLNDSDDRLLLKRFFACSLGLRKPLFGDLLCTNVGTGGGQQGQGENLLCGSCEMEMGTACQLYQELANKLMELKEILDNSTKKVSDKLSANLHQKVAKQLNHSFGSKKKFVQLVQKARELLSLELKSATAKAKRVEDELSGDGSNGQRKPGSGTSELELEDSPGLETNEFGTQHENRKANVLEPVTVKLETDQGGEEFEGTEKSGVNKTVEENEAMDLDVESDDDGCDGDSHNQRNGGGSTSTSASTAKAKENLGLGDGVEVDRPFLCPKCSDSFKRIDALRSHYRREHGASEYNSSAAEAQTISFQCLRCKNYFKNIEDFKTHEEWCKPLKVQNLETKCRICGKNFSSNSELKTHEIIHTDVKKSYQCPKCKRQFNFNQKSDCKAHMKICNIFKASAETKNSNEIYKDIDPL